MFSGVPSVACAPQEEATRVASQAEARIRDRASPRLCCFRCWPTASRPQTPIVTASGRVRNRWGHYRRSGALEQSTTFPPGSRGLFSFEAPSVRPDTSLGPPLRIPVSIQSFPSREACYGGHGLGHNQTGLLSREAEGGGRGWMPGEGWDALFRTSDPKSAFPSVSLPLFHRSSAPVRPSPRIPAGRPRARTSRGPIAGAV